MCVCMYARACVHPPPPLLAVITTATYWYNVGIMLRVVLLPFGTWRTYRIYAIIERMQAPDVRHKIQHYANSVPERLSGTYAEIIPSQSGFKRTEICRCLWATSNGTMPDLFRHIVYGV